MREIMSIKIALLILLLFRGLSSESPQSISNKQTITTPAADPIIDNKARDVSRQQNANRKPEMMMRYAGPTKRTGFYTDQRADYLLTVTLPWTLGMLGVLLLFLYIMRVDGKIYRLLTESYVPPSARYRLEEEERMSEAKEVGRQSQSQWDELRARWKKDHAQKGKVARRNLRDITENPEPGNKWDQLLSRLYSERDTTSSRSSDPF